MESATENFTSKFLSYIRECIPEKTITVRPRDKPWFDSLLRKSIRIRDRLRNKALKTRNESDWSAYKKIRNSINNMKKHAISNYYDSIDTYLDDSSKDNNKLYWKLMKESFNIKLSNDIPQIQIYNGNGVNTLANSDADKIEALNTYLSSISTIDDTNVTLPNMYSLCNNNLSNIIIEEQEILDIITILPVNKAIDSDCISHKMLKSTKSTVVKPLTLFFNRS